MSMNILFVAQRDVQVCGTGAIEQQTENFDPVWQTPTSITWAIQGSEDPVQAYRLWVLGQAQDEQEPIYERDLDDPWALDLVVGYRTVNPAREHVVQFDQWVQDHRARGFDITVQAV